jgi:ABC-type dipeptide/oligopeptide/nickel transport system permease component
MLKFFVRRIFWSIPLLLLVMLATFALMRGSGGSPFQPPEGYVPLPGPLERLLSDYYHLDDPWIVQYAIYVKHAFTLNFGPSMIYRSVTVTDVVRHGFPVTVELVLLAAAWALPLGVGLGMFAAVRRNTIWDLLATAGATVLFVVPVFFLAFVLSRYLVFQWHVFPPGWSSWQARILPSFALALSPTGYIARLVRAGMVETLEEDYVRTALAKGLRRRRIMFVHVLRNSLVPFISAAVPMIALLITGAFFVENFFAVPGVSAAFVTAALTRDYPMLMGLTVVLAAVVLAANLFSDLMLAVIDPRVREASR